MAPDRPQRLAVNLLKELPSRHGCKGAAAPHAQAPRVNRSTSLPSQCTMKGYSRSCWGLGSLLRWRGSEIGRGLPFAVLSGGLAAVLHFALDDKMNTLRERWVHPHPVHAFTVLLALVVALRCVYQVLASLCRASVFRDHGGPDTSNVPKSRIECVCAVCSGVFRAASRPRPIDPLFASLLQQTNWLRRSLELAASVVLLLLDISSTQLSSLLCCSAV